MNLIQIIKTIIFGIVEGITEWLPISSTGHMILLDEFFGLQESGFTPEFVELFIVVIQFGAILAVVVLFWNKLWPFCAKKEEHFIKKDTWSLWFHILVSCIPFGIAGVLFDDKIEEFIVGDTRSIIVASMLIFYGILFIIIEKGVIKHREKIRNVAGISYLLAFIIGCIQVLAMVPGTSRSGVSIIGMMLLGCTRVVSAEYSFFLAIPAMAGSSLISVLKFEGSLSGGEIGALIIGMVVSFLVSLFAIKFLVGYVKKHNFVVFGWYRIALGIVVLACVFAGVI